MRIAYALPMMGMAWGLSVGGGCWGPAAGHCANLNGDLSCAEGYFCSQCTPENNGCSATVPGDDCYFPGSVGASMSTTGGTVQSNGGTEADADTDSTGTTGIGTGGQDTSTEPQEESGGKDTTGDVGCTNDSDCSDTRKPVCNDGSCVECTTSNTSECTTNQVCNGGTFSCSNTCRAHRECMNGDGTDGPGCDIFTGTCLPAENVWHVNGDADTTKIATGTIDAPFQSIAAALAILSDHEIPVGTIITHDGCRVGDCNIYDPVSIQTGTVAIIPSGSDRPRVQASSGPLIEIRETGTTAYIEGLIFSGSSDPGAEIRHEARAILDRCEIIQNAGGVRVRDDNTYLALRNSIASSTSNEDNERPMNIEDGSTVDIIYSTLINNGSGSTNFDTIECSDTPTVRIRNSIIVSQSGGRYQDGELLIDGWNCHDGAASVLYSAGEDTPEDTGNVAICDWPIDCTEDEHMSDFFIDTEDSDAHVDFRLSRIGFLLFEGIARRGLEAPQSLPEGFYDLYMDIDYDLRPTTISGLTPDHAGADAP